jgi:hypothetical protein
MKKWKYLLITLSFITFGLTAQSYHNALSFGYAYASHSLNPSKSIIDKWYLQISAPLKLKNKDYLLINSELHKQNLSFDNNLQYTCFKTNLSANYLHLSDKRNTIGILNFSNNFEKGHYNQGPIQIGAGILFSKKQSNTLRWKYGLYVNKEYFGMLLVPLFGWDYKINAKYRVFGILPQNMKFEYKASNKFRTGFVFDTPLNTYKLSQSSQQYIDQRHINVGLYQSIYLSKNLVLELAVKQPVTSKQKIFNKEQIYVLNILGAGIGGKRADNPLPLQSFKTGLAFDISLNYRIEVE